jgi:serine phosphatase RsbU (regulator of sigma subunit)
VFSVGVNRSEDEGIDWIAITVGAVAALLIAFVLAITIRRERKARRRFEILGEIATVSEAGDSLEETFDAICSILVPALADFCMIDVLDEDRVPSRAAVRVGPGGKPEFEQGLAERLPSTPQSMVDGQSRSSLAPRFYERVSEQDLRELAHDDAEDLEFLRSLGMRSAITVALQARGEVTGALTIGVAWSRRRYRREDARFAWILSGRVALALDNAGLFADLERAERARAEIAETLQRGLLPSPLPHIPGWSIAAMYRPAGAENEVGGDFYDVFRVPGGWMLVIGDVTGRGAHAASVTAVARYTLRTAAVLTDDPLVAMQTLNRALLARGDSALCSLAALTLSEDRFEPIRLAVAGHPPPLLVDAESVSEVASADPVLGAFHDAEWGISRCEVEPGQQLVIVTDGIAEAQGPEGRFGEARLRAELGGTSNPAMALQRLEASLHAFTEGKLDDDVAMLAIARASHLSSTDLEAEAWAPPADVVGSLEEGNA